MHPMLGAADTCSGR